MKTYLKKFHLLWAFLFYCACTIFFTWPITLHLKTSIVGGMGDNIYFVWLIRWYQKVFLEGQAHPFFAPMLNYPQGWNLSTTETSLASALPGVPFSVLFGPIAGYNIAILLTFVLAGFFMYLWVRSLTKSGLAGLVAGAIFAFSPYHLSHFVVGHLNLCGMQWLPLYFWGLTVLLDNVRKMNWKYILLAGLSLGLIAFTSMYYLYMTLIFSVIFIFVYLCFSKFKLLTNRFFWLRMLLMVVIGSPFLFFALRPFVSLAQAGTLASRPIEYAAMYSASPTDLFLPASDHFLFGAPISQWFDRSLWNESSLYVGAFALLLAIVAFVVRKKTPHRAFIWSAVAVILSSFILALGINLHWNNQDVVWQIPAFLQPVFQKTQTLITLPAAWLFNHLPFFDKMRTIMRFGCFALLFIPVLAGIGLDYLQNKLTAKKGVALVVVVMALVLFDFYPGSYANLLTEPAPRAVDLWLAEQPGDGAVVQMPFAESSDQAQVYYTLFHQKPFLGGDFNANQPVQFLEIKPTLDQFPDPSSIALLRELGVQFIVVDRVAYTDFAAFEQQVRTLGLTKLTELDGQIVFTFSTP